MYEANMNLNHEPSVTIEMIDAATTEEERQALIIKRTKEENQFADSNAYIVTTPKVLKEPYDGIQQFSAINDNLLWSFHYPDDTKKKPTLEVTVFEFSTIKGLALIGSFNLTVQIVAISEHDTSCSLYKAINRKGCFDLTMTIKHLTYTDLDTSPEHLELKKHEEVPYDQIMFSVGRPIQVVWSPYKGVGRIIGTGHNSYVPMEFILNDGFPTHEMLKQYFTTALVKSRS